jgi:hypothetical protein
MKNEFVSYTQALALKELGFDDRTLTLWHLKREELISSPHKGILYGYSNTLDEPWISAPLKQQAFKFFREKYNLDGSMSVDVWNKKTTSYRIIGGIEGIVEADSYGSLYDMDSTEYDSYEESEQACIDRLIEIVKDK